MSRMVKIDLIDPSPWADLFAHDEEHVVRLTDDVSERGITTPLHVYPHDGRFELLAGHDRLEAARRAGLAEVPVEMRSTLAAEDDRFAYFIKDNTLRKDVDKKALAKAVIRRFPDRSLTFAALTAGCAVGTAHAAKEELRESDPQLFNTENQTVGVDGVRQPARKPSGSIVGRKSPVKEDNGNAAAAPRKPVADDAPRPQREANIRIVDEPEGVDVGAAIAQHRREYKDQPATVVESYIVALPVPPARFEDEKVAAAVASPRFDHALEKMARGAHAFLSRIIAAIDARKEDERVSA